MRGVRPIRSLLATALALVGLAVVPATAQAHGSPPGHHPPTLERVCPQPSGPLQAACTAMIRTDVPPIASLPPGANPPGLSPFDIRSAYKLFGQHGRGRTVAVTDAYHDPNLESDLAVYRRQFHLPRAPPQTAACAWSTRTAAAPCRPPSTQAGRWRSPSTWTR